MSAGDREQDSVLGLAELALLTDPLAAQQPVDDRERLGKAGDRAVVWDPEGAKLALVPAGAEAEDEPAAADLIEGGGHLGEQSWRMETGAGHQRTEGDPIGHRRKCGQQRPGLPGAPLGPPVAGEQEVVAEPDGVEADLFGRASHREVLRPAHVAFDFRELDSHPKRHGGSLRARPADRARS